MVVGVGVGSGGKSFFCRFFRVRFFDVCVLLEMFVGFIGLRKVFIRKL